MSVRSVEGIFAFAIGFFAGAALTMLLAPRTGEETRRKLRFAIEELGTAVQNISEEMHKNVASPSTSPLE